MADRILWFCTHSMPGNTGIQLCAAHILAHKFGHNSIKILKDINEVDVENTQRFHEDMWVAFYPFLNEPITPIYERFFKGDMYLQGYFQYSESLVQSRPYLLSRLATDTTPISMNGTTMREFLEAPTPIAIDPEDIVLHVRLADFIGGNLVIDPAPQIAILRQARYNRLIIVCTKPKTDAETNYLKLFEEFHPVLQHGTELEDFAVLRSAKRILVTNSTFSWFAAFLGEATERWIPEPTFNQLGKISDTDHLYAAAMNYPLRNLDIPVEPFLPVSGEFLQSMCDYSILDREKKAEYHRWIDVACPVERQLYIEEEWAPEVFQAKTLFIYPKEDSCCAKHVFKHTWPNLRLIMFHNSDYSLDAKTVIPFLDANPNVWCWAQNLTCRHPRIRVVPIGEENRMWRNDGSATDEPMNTVSRNPERNVDIFVSHWGKTSPIRSVWYNQIQRISSERVRVCPKMPKEIYLEIIKTVRAMVCPPGNGVDTHRHWDALTAGTWAIVEDNAHTQLLLRDYPSLHLIPVADAENVHLTPIPDTIAPFHPLLLRQFWRTLFDSYLL